MANVIDMQDMRHLNLFERVTRISTRFCFRYNETIYFCVPKPFIQRAVGENGSNIKRLSEILRRRIKIIPIPNGVEHARQFIEAIVSPVEFKDLEVTPNEIILTAGSVQTKATLMGRNKKRLLEMKKIIKDFFGREYRIA